MDELNLYMDENNMPNQLRIRLREYFQYSKQLNRQRYYQALLMEMSPSLRGEVANFINSAWLENIPFFNPPHMLVDERETFCTAISLRLKPEAYAPQEVVIREGEQTEKFYLLQRGVMATRGRIIGTGSYIGDDFVLHKTRRDYSVRAITYIDVFSLSKSGTSCIYLTLSLSLTHTHTHTSPCLLYCLCLIIHSFSHRLISFLFFSFSLSPFLSLHRFRSRLEFESSQNDRPKSSSVCHSNILCQGTQCLREWNISSPSIV